MTRKYSQAFGHHQDDQESQDIPISVYLRLVLHHTQSEERLLTIYLLVQYRSFDGV